jgi:hypothetical protein
VGGGSWLDHGHVGPSSAGEPCKAELRGATWDQVARGYARSRAEEGGCAGVPSSIDLSVSWVQVRDR